MDKELVTKLQTALAKEQELEKEIAEKQDDAYRALAELHEAIEELYIYKKGEKQILVDVNDFIETVMDKVFKKDVEGIQHQQAELRDAIEAATFYVSKIIDLNNNIEYKIKMRD